MSLAVLTLNWLQLIKGSTFTFIQYVVVLLGPGYAIITAIWPTDERIGWSLRAGMGFVLGLFFILFLPIIFTYLKLGYLTPNLTKILLILAVIFSLVAIARRRKPEKETLESDSQLTLEESIQRVREMEGRTEKAKFVEYEHEKEPYPDEYYEEEPKESSEEIEEYSEEIEGKKDVKKSEEKIPKEIISEDEIIEKYRDLKEEKPLQYERIKDEYVDEDYPDKTSETSPLMVEGPVKTEPVRTEYEREMDKPVWPHEEQVPKSRFKYWDLVFILFLSGISLLFLYFNPLETSTTSITFFIVLLFILGYASITIIFPDKSKVSAKNLIIVSVIIAAILFTLSFLACIMQILPTVPKYLVRIMFIASLILVAGAFLRKWTSTRKKEYLPEEEVAPEERVTEEKVSGEDEETKEKIIPDKESGTGREIPKEKVEPMEKKVPLARPVAKEEKDQIKTFKTPVEPSEPDVKEPVRGFFGRSKWEKALSIILLIALVLAIAATIYIIITPHQGEKFTEFYILGPEGKASDYPTNLTSGQNGSVIIGVVNHEYATKDYQLVVKVNETILKNDTITLTNGQKVEIPFSFIAGDSGEKKLEFLLYKLPDHENVYRSLHLWLNIQ
ncbi:DUF1616 domain-containing protein [Methanobacterium ferruginis]|uniref:DUF1616 domain-containing protein n=1 Tax=Methanobacterium ferruginis TaxID=710191 RepID=UPI00257396ED|nr:DUF1616 domain-containing protein [Methanobacterium ferruginis]BDZ69019.1 hypothetical protein GCM10025860_24670 [Methanobacterium ferruginis]